MDARAVNASGLATPGVQSDRPSQWLSEHDEDRLRSHLHGYHLRTVRARSRAAYIEVQQSNIPERADALAKEIEAAQPQLVGCRRLVFGAGPFLGRNHRDL